MTPASAVGNGDSSDPALNADGRYVAFQSLASNLVSGDGNGTYDVFRRDLLTGQTIRVSADLGGGDANNWSFGPAISGDGRFVAFESDATDLVVGDTNGVRDCFLRDCTTGATIRVSVTAAGGEADGSSRLENISADGTQILFLSSATNLVPGAWNGSAQLYVRDLIAGTTEHVSKSSSGAPAAPPSPSSIDGSICGDGRYVGFTSFASNLVAGDTNGAHDVFRHDRVTGVTIRVSVTSTGGQAAFGGTGPSLSADGNIVGFASVSGDLVPSDFNGVYDVFIRDVGASTTTRISVDTNGQDANGASHAPNQGGWVSADGRHVAFRSIANDLVPNDTNLVDDVFVRDRTAGTTRRASVSSAGAQGNQASDHPAISSNGRFVAFYSDASTLVAGDANGLYDVFVHDRYVLQIDGCFGNATTLRFTSAAMTIGMPAQFVVTTAVHPSGSTILYFGADGRDASGCGVPVSGIGEMLLAASPPPTAVASAPTVAHVALPFVNVPNDPTLVGAQVFLQAVNVASGPQYEASNALRILIGQ